MCQNVRTGDKWQQEPSRTHQEMSATNHQDSKGPYTKISLRFSGVVPNPLALGVPWGCPFSGRVLTGHAQPHVAGHAPSALEHWAAENRTWLFANRYACSCRVTIPTACVGRMGQHWPIPSVHLAFVGGIRGPGDP